MRIPSVRVPVNNFFPSGEKASENANFSVASDRQDQWPVAGDVFNRTGHLDQRSGQRTREQHCNQSRDEDSANSDNENGMPQTRGGTHDHSI